MFLSNFWVEDVLNKMLIGLVVFVKYVESWEVVVFKSLVLEVCCGN